MSTDPGTKFQEFKLPLLLAHSHDLWEVTYPFTPQFIHPAQKEEEEERRKMAIVSASEEIIGIK